MYRSRVMPPPDKTYVELMSKPTHKYSGPRTFDWPTMPPGDYRIGVRPPVSQHGTFKQNPFQFELRQPSKDARTPLEIARIVVGKAPPEMFQVLEEEAEENNNGNNNAAAGAATAGRKRKRNNTCNKKTKCPRSRNRKRSASRRASPS